MLEHSKIQSLDDFFLPLEKRRQKEVYFYRINGYSDEIQSFICSYYKAASRSGVVIQGKIPNPNEQNLAYYREIMGTGFQLELSSIASGLKKWLPRMSEYQRQSVSTALYHALESMKKEGKTNDMVQNAYIKYMCWLYYRFERIICLLGKNTVPKILYEGMISKYELTLISILSNAGCDVILLQYGGDTDYLKKDPGSLLSEDFQGRGLQPFPSDFSLKKVREECELEVELERLLGAAPIPASCTNAWIKGKGLEDVRTVIMSRGNDTHFFYNCLIRINGAENRVTYENELYQFQQELKQANRHVVIFEKQIPLPTPAEIAGIRRCSYTGFRQMLLDLTENIQYAGNTQLQMILRKAFVDVMTEEPGKENLNRLLNRAVYLLCWIKRYQSELFPDWKFPQIACLIYLGGCRNDSEAVFLRYLAKIPTDVLILCPDLNVKCQMEDQKLYEITYPESLCLDRYPQDGTQIKMGTMAYHAERDLDTLLYEDTGIYRNQQYARANVINLQTMYEEIPILWDEEVKYRPGFHTSDGIVDIPVIFSKISGIKDGKVSEYWKQIHSLVTKDTIMVQKVPYMTAQADNPMRSSVTSFYKNGRLQIDKIKAHPQYTYGILRTEMQDYMLEKLHLLLEQRLIRGIGENGMEYTVIATVLNLPAELLRMIQKFDFTKKNPKLIYINAGETPISLEDSIVTAFLNLLGFDILFFVPTGYQSIERYFNKRIMEEHQIGEYLYDLDIPDFRHLPEHGGRLNLRNILFNRREN